MTYEGWPDDGLTAAADVPEVVRHRVGPPEDPDRYEVLGDVDNGGESWHVLDHRADAGAAVLLTLAALRPFATHDEDASGSEVPPGDEIPTPTDSVGDLEVVRTPREDEDGAVAPVSVADRRRWWQQRAAGLAKVHHPRLAGLRHTFAGPAPHVPEGADLDGPEWDYAVLEQAAGRSVADWLRDDPGAAMDERFAILAAAAAVLEDLHRGSDTAPPLVHGDITPRTLRLGGFWPADGVRLAAGSLGGRPRPGALPYTAPEVRAGELPSAASDVYGFGATALHVLTGQPPATGPDGSLDPVLVRRQLGAAPQTAAHPALADLLLQSLSADPHERPDRLQGWVNALRTVVDVLPPLAGPSAPLPLAVAPSARVRTLPRRPFAVTVGALLLATAGGAIAITAVQQGRLAEVPNPIAIVQPPPVTTTPVGPDGSEVAPPAPTGTDADGGGSGGGASSSTTGRGPSSSAPVPEPAVPVPGAPTPAPVPSVPGTVATPSEGTAPTTAPTPPPTTPTRPPTTAPTGPPVVTLPPLPVDPPTVTPPGPTRTPDPTDPPTTGPTDRPTTAPTATPTRPTTPGTTTPAELPGGLPTIVEGPASPRGDG
ncbi:hypothetical protein ACFFKU_00650 [Kineococcus gynurae]|uniref:non-specific serine/threonine protein kinase n=1 Tax=Kineococcus gynurae TaxID=452979 RepID=A0ABV5LPN4_9ACTN